MPAMRPQDYWRYPARDLITRYGASLLTYNTQVSRDFAAHAAEVMGMPNRSTEQIQNASAAHSNIALIWAHEDKLRRQGTYNPSDDRCIMHSRMTGMDATDALCLAYMGCGNDGLYVVQDYLWDNYKDAIDKEHVMKFLACGAEMNNIKSGFLERLFGRAISANQLRGMLDIMELSKENIYMQNVIIEFKNHRDFGAVLARVSGILNGGA